MHCILADAKGTHDDWNGNVDNGRGQDHGHGAKHGRERDVVAVIRAKPRKHRLYGWVRHTNRPLPLERVWFLGGAWIPGVCPAAAGPESS